MKMNEMEVLVASAILQEQAVHSDLIIIISTALFPDNSILGKNILYNTIAPSYAVTLIRENGLSLPLFGSFPNSKHFLLLSSNVLLIMC